jgi:hypothetical protein
MIGFKQFQNSVVRAILPFATPLPPPLGRLVEKNKLTNAGGKSARKKCNEAIAKYLLFPKMWKGK